MNDETFYKMVKELRYSAEKTMPKDEIMEFWLSKVQHIPDEPVPWIRDEIIARFNGKFPERFHVVVQQCYADWLRAHPEKKAYQGSTCQYCEDGLIFAQRYVEQYKCKETFVFKCVCQPRSNPAYQYVTVKQLREAGWEVLRNRYMQSVDRQQATSAVNKVAQSLNYNPNVTDKEWQERHMAMREQAAELERRFG